MRFYQFTRPEDERKYMRKNTMFEKLRQHRCVIGPNLQIDSPWLVEIIGQAGFDFVMLDAEHGAAMHSLPMLIIAADAAGITPIVRVPTHERGFLLPPLEMGAGGLQVTMVNNADEARALVQETKFAPVGQRGISNVSRAAKFGALPIEVWVEIANRETMLIAQLETRQALDNAVEIAHVPGIDMIFIGPGDLAQSMNMIGKTDRSEMIDAIKKTVRAVRGIVPVGTTAFSTEEARLWRDEGVLSILTSSMNPIRKAFEKLHEELRRGVEQNGTKD
jgi:4-hydroxy-2-oxoheptanedioate aldolase